jgi:hypothetical protein
MKHIPRTGMTDTQSKERDTGREVAKMEPKYEIYVRLPFNRGDFVDPPPVSSSFLLLFITFVSEINSMYGRSSGTSSSRMRYGTSFMKLSGQRERLIVSALLFHADGL